jgi:hypothetical protein
VRFLLVSTAVGVIVLGGAAAIAIAAYPSDSVTVYTGCLSNSGTSAGNIGAFAVGSNPAKPCGSNQLLIHLSGGTITQVTAGTGVAVSGVGGTGYVNNGFATVGLDPKFQLPQSGCSNGQFDASNGTGSWSCKDQKTYSGSDFAVSNQSCDSGQFLTGFDTSGLKKCAADQTYSNGTGLDLTSNVFSLSSGYQLPQGCSNGDVAVSNGSNSWSCHSAVTSSGTYSYRIESGPWNIGDDFGFGDNQSTTAWCNYGDIVTGGGFYDDNTDIRYSDNAYGSGQQQGWFVDANEGAFASGHFAAFADCLHLG